MTHPTSGLRYLVGALVALALGSACERTRFSFSDDEPIARGASSSTGGVGGGPSGTGGSLPTDPCSRPANTASSFQDQTVSFLLPARKELYALVTDAEAAALRAGAPLIPKPVAGAPQSPLGAMLQSLATSASAERRQLVEILKTRFASPRSTWPNPWALRLVDHPGSQHMNALRIVLRDNALTVLITPSTARVMDLRSGNVDVAVALAEPERIAAIFYQLDGRDAASGFDTSCEGGMRELALGSEAMVEAWSLGTPEILARLNDDIDRLTSLFEYARGCPSPAPTRGTFRSSTVCQVWRTFNTATEYLAYQWSLATPSEPYRPTPQNLASLVQALQDDRFEPAPFTVKPEPPVGMGGSGSGGAGGGGEASGGEASGGAPSEGAPSGEAGAGGDLGG